MKNIKEKVLKGMFSKEFLDSKHTPETELTMKGIESAIDETLTERNKEVGTIIDDFPFEEINLKETFDNKNCKEIGEIMKKKLKEAFGIK